MLKLEEGFVVTHRAWKKWNISARSNGDARYQSYCSIHVSVELNLQCNADIYEKPPCHVSEADNVCFGIGKTGLAIPRTLRRQCFIRMKSVPTAWMKMQGYLSLDIQYQWSNHHDMWPDNLATTAARHLCWIVIFLDADEVSDIFYNEHMCIAMRNCVHGFKLHNPRSSTWLDSAPRHQDHDSIHCDQGLQLLSALAKFRSLWTCVHARVYITLSDDEFTLSPKVENLPPDAMDCLPLCHWLHLKDLPHPRIHEVTQQGHNAAKPTMSLKLCIKSSLSRNNFPQRTQQLKKEPVAQQLKKEPVVLTSIAHNWSHFGVTQPLLAFTGTLQNPLMV